MKPEARIASLNDIEAIAALFDQYRIFYSMKSNIDRCRKFVLDRLSANDSIFFLALIDGKASGFTQIYPSFSSVAMKPIWVLNDLFIDQAFRKLGCAKLLMRQVEAEAVSQNVYSIKLATAIDNLAAKHLYDSTGYSKITQFECYSLTPHR